MRPRRWVAAGLVVCLTSSCAFVLHPERRGNNAMPIDAVPLVVDILLFLPGVVPGVIALVLDFGSGAIYLNHRGERKASRTDAEPRESERVYVRLVDEQGNLMDERALVVRAPEEVGESLTASLEDMTAKTASGKPVYVEIATDNGPTIRLDPATL